MDLRIRMDPEVVNVVIVKKIVENFVSVLIMIREAMSIQNPKLLLDHQRVIKMGVPNVATTFFRNLNFHFLYGQESQFHFERNNEKKIDFRQQSKMFLYYDMILH